MPRDVPEAAVWTAALRLVRVYLAALDDAGDVEAPDWCSPVFIEPPELADAVGDLIDLALGCEAVPL